MLMYSFKSSSALSWFISACASLLILSVSSVEAQPRVSDFNSETIDYSGVTFDGDEPLPLELVEEQTSRKSKAAEAAEEAAKATVEKPTQAEGNSDPSSVSSSEVDETTTTILNVKDADIATLVKTFSKLTKRNYVVDSSVKGKITIHLPNAVSMDEALRIFDSVLLLKGFTTVPIENNTWKVVPARDAKQTTVPLMLESPEHPSDVLVTQLFRLKHIQASELQQALSQFVSKDGLLNAFEGTNSVIIIDSSANIARLRKLIDQLDVPARNQEITIVPILHADANDIATKINDILGEGDDQSRARLQTARAGAGGAQNNRAQNQGSAEAVSTTTGKALPAKIISDERTNSLIVVADPELTNKVRALVEQLDTEVDRSGGRFHVVRLKHADSEQLSEILNSLITGESSSGTSGNAANTGSSLSRSQSTNPNSGGEDRSALRNQIRNALLRGGNQGQTGNAAPGRVSFEGEVLIASDPATNSLVINASRGDFQRINDVIKQLDVHRRQVLVEATILEVSLSSDEGSGIELQGATGTDDAGFIAQTNFGNLTNLLTNPGALTDLTIAAASTGTITLPGGVVIPSQAVLLNAVSRHQNVNVLSSPTILATDNEEAEIIVGENVPFVTSTSTDQTNLTNTFNQIQRQDVGITLRITPQTSLGDYVVLKIFVEISNVVAATRNDPNGPTTTIRTTETTVAVKSRQMVITGGLIADNLTDSERGVSFLSDIPVLGHLFTRNDKNIRKTNLLVFITPTVVGDQFEAREKTVEHSLKLKDEMALRQLDNQREDVLNNRNIDNVVEAVEPSDIMPSPILPPSTLSTQKPPASEKEKAAFERTKDRISGIVESEVPTKAPVAEEEPTLELSVAPKLPGESISVEEVAPTRKRMADTNQQADAVYVVLRELPADAIGTEEDTPFSAIDTHGTVGVRVSGGIDGSASNFFQAGGKYVYETATAKRSFVCLGKYSKSEQASVIHPSLANETSWYSLSPKELVELGASTWKKE